MHKANKGLRKSVAKKPESAGKRKMSMKAKKAPKTKKAVKKVVTVAKRFSHEVRDAQGRVLPVDYETHELHDPYDYFFHDTSKMFDDHPHANEFAHRFPTHDALVTARMTANDQMLEQIPQIRAKITCPKEKEAFEQVLVASLQPSEILSKEEVAYKLEQRGFNSIHAVTEPTEGSWKEFLCNDLQPGRLPLRQKIETIAHYTAMISSVAFLTYLGYDACQQYFYDLEYPLNHH